MPLIPQSAQIAGIVECQQLLPLLVGLIFQIRQKFAPTVIAIMPGSGTHRLCVRCIQADIVRVNEAIVFQPAADNRAGAVQLRIGGKHRPVLVEAKCLSKLNETCRQLQAEFGQGRQVLHGHNGEQTNDQQGGNNALAI